MLTSLGARFGLAGIDGKFFQVSEKLVVITGAAGQLGGAYAGAFLGQGARVVCLDLQRSDVDRQNEAEYPDAYRFVQTDLTSRENVEAAPLKKCAVSLVFLMCL